MMTSVHKACRLFKITDPNHLVQTIFFHIFFSMKVKIHAHVYFLNFISLSLLTQTSANVWHLFRFRAYA